MMLYFLSMHIFIFININSKANYNCSPKYIGIFIHDLYCTSSSSETSLNRHSMDRRRLEVAHLQYVILTVCRWCPQKPTTYKCAK